MSFLFGGNKAPDIQPVAAPPVEKKVKEKEEKKIRRGMGNQSTILTSGLGILIPVKTQKKTLLGE